MNTIIFQIFNNITDIKTKRHPKCKGYATSGLDYEDFDCGYDTTIMCEDCKYCAGGMGRKDPEAKCNQVGYRS